MSFDVVVAIQAHRLALNAEAPAVGLSGLAVCFALGMEQRSLRAGGGLHELAQNLASIDFGFEFLGGVAQVGGLFTVELMS